MSMEWSSIVLALPNPCLLSHVGLHLWNGKASRCSRQVQERTMGQDRYVPALSLPPNNKARITHSYPATTNCKAERVAFQIYQEVKRCALNRIPTKLLNKYGNVYSDVVYSIWLVSVYISGYLSSPLCCPCSVHHQESGGDQRKETSTVHQEQVCHWLPWQHILHLTV